MTNTVKIPIHELKVTPAMMRGLWALYDSPDGIKGIGYFSESLQVKPRSAGWIIAKMLEHGLITEVYAVKHWPSGYIEDIHDAYAITFRGVLAAHRGDRASAIKAAQAMPRPPFLLRGPEFTGDKET